MKKIFVLIFTLISFTNLFGLEWAMSNHNSTLTISGEGAMPNFEDKQQSGGKDIPWNRFSEDITAVVIREGITSIGDNAFAYLFNLERIYLPESLEVIGYGAFNWCPKLLEPKFPDNLKKIGDKAFLYSDLISEVTLQPDVEFNEKSVFSAGTKINIIGHDKEKISGSF